MLADAVYDDVFSAMDEVDSNWRGRIGPTGRWTWVQATLLPAEPDDDRYDVLIWGAGRRFAAFKRAIQGKVGDRVRNVLAVRHRDLVAATGDAGGVGVLVRRRRVRVNPAAKVFDRRTSTRL